MLVSIITVCKNASKTIDDTIQSVVSQSYGKIEYIVVDGASTDSTLDILKKYDGKISKLISEPDNGIYDAMNKGIRHATGDYVLILNADDKLCDSNVIERFVQMCNGADIVYGDLMLFDRSNASLHKHLKYDNIDDFFWFMDTLSPQCTFVKRAMLNLCKSHDINYKICADYDLFLRMIFSGNSTMQYMGFPISYYDVNGVSSRRDAFRNMKAERKKIIKSHFGSLTQTRAMIKIEKCTRGILKVSGQNDRMKNLIKKTFLHEISKRKSVK